MEEIKDSKESRIEGLLNEAYVFLGMPNTSLLPCRTAIADWQKRVETETMCATSHWKKRALDAEKAMEESDVTSSVMSVYPSAKVGSLRACPSCGATESAIKMITGLSIFDLLREYVDECSVCGNHYHV